MLLVTGLDMHTICKPSNAPLPSETFEGLHVVYIYIYIYIYIFMHV